ncbi:sel1 repeat family protein [Hyphomonas sp. WL0036]|uniref:tetratricopeptide repeat protein n=1 Tax=Hyphomonas sediminis TaxID=2866160 RepID=UPI001C81B7DB|nr:tetratricopeptide repeat protein [Hyphomonas sediminis]MBY9068138.1 sel1 repeat family protein [Hyphomonas sediminis]
MSVRFVEWFLLGSTILIAVPAYAQFLDVTPVPEAVWAEPGSVSYLQNEAAKSHYAKGHYADAKVIWEKLAELGNLEATNNLGVYYREGKAVPADYEKTISYWNKAAARNFTPSLMNLAALYKSGYPGHPADARKAFEAYVTAGRAGDENGAFNAANMAFLGEGVVANFSDGHRLLTLAADLGNPAAFMMMGKFDEMGFNPDGDIISARDWYEKARLMGHPMAEAALASLPKPGLRTVYELAGQQRHTDARRLAAGLCQIDQLPQACDVQGQYDLFGAPGVYPDYVGAAKALDFACASGVGDSCLNFAHAVAEGAQRAPNRFSLSDFRKAEQAYARACDSQQNYTACAGVVFFNYYSVFGLGSRQKIMDYGPRACMNGGNDFACDVWMPMFNANVAATYGRYSGSSSGGSGFGNFLGNTLTAIVGGLAAGAEAYNAGAGGYTSSYRGSANSGASSNTSSDMRDFNQYLNSVRSIGTAYTAPCPPSNPYCR